MPVTWLREKPSRYPSRTLSKTTKLLNSKLLMTNHYEESWKYSYGVYSNFVENLNLNRQFSLYRFALNWVPGRSKVKSEDEMCGVKIGMNLRMSRQEKSWIE
ncbi:hypothetical protein DINM_002743 [Dirofilaria immitis]|nr:hypothetical protein [Dirofilaria immitis]